LEFGISKHQQFTTQVAESTNPLRDGRGIDLQVSEVGKKQLEVGRKSNSWKEESRK
jgi:hypothetical protein